MKPSEILSAKERLKKLEAEVERLRAHNFGGHAKLLGRAIVVAEIFYKELNRVKQCKQ